MNAALRPYTLVCLLALAALSCSHAPSEDETLGQGGLHSDPAKSTVFGDAPVSGSPETARGIATQVVMATVSQCGGGCSADLATGHARLREGKMLEAFDALKCADSPEAAFGAGLSKLLGALEGPAADRLLADLGQPHFPASDLFGPDGYLARAAERFNGTAQVTLAGALALRIDSQRVEADDWELAVHHNDGAREISLNVETDAAWPDGMLMPATYDCANAGLASGSLPRVYLSIREGKERIECQVPYSMATGCNPDGGALRVVTSGTEPGERAEFEFANLRLSCERQSEADDIAPTALGSVTLNGSAFATVTGDIDVRGLHPVFSSEKDETFIDRIDAALGFPAFANHVAAIAGELAAARCYFDKAAKGSGQVFVLPGSLYAGEDLPVDASDARIFASAASLGSALLELGTAYEIDHPLRALLCYTHNDLGEHADCPTEEAFVSGVNAAVKAARVRPDRLEAARRLLLLGLTDFDQGVRALSERSALVRNPNSAPGWGVAQELAVAARASLESGSTLVPHVAPAVRVDLAEFFTAPPDPAAIGVALLRRSEFCDTPGSLECESEIDLDPAYFELFFAGETDADFDGNYDFADDERVQDGLREVLLKLDAGGLFLGG